MLSSKLIKNLENSLGDKEVINKKEVDLKSLFLSFVFIASIPVSIVISSLVNPTVLIILGIIMIFVSSFAYQILIIRPNMAIFCMIIYIVSAPLMLLFISLYIKSAFYEITYLNTIPLVITITFIIVIFIKKILSIVEKLFKYDFKSSYLLFVFLCFLMSFIALSYFSTKYTRFHFIESFIASFITILLVGFFSFEYDTKIRRLIQNGLQKDKQIYLYVLPITLIHTFVFDVICSCISERKFDNK